MKFSELELHPYLLGAIEKQKFDEATPVQTATIPHILEGRDVAGLAQTGTGKTAAFLLPLMERVLRAGKSAEDLPPEKLEALSKRGFTDWKSNQFILVLVPTRELAEQVYENAMRLKGDSPLRAVSIYGGVAYDKQKQGLRDGVEFVIATPGRLIDLYKEHLLDLKQVRAIVFDEADRMFDMGFKDDMKFILQRVPKERQFLVFSATLNMDVLNTAYQFGANPVDIDVSRDQAKAENVEDSIFHVGSEEKPAYVLSLIKKHKPRQTIIFSNFKMNVPRIAQYLNDNKVPAVGISSLLTQAQRTRVMEQFKSSTSDLNILVATDVAARGLDIKGVDLVINYELPDDAENYVHRIGRTGRAGEKGKAFSLVSDRDVEALQRIEDYLRHKVGVGWMEEDDIVKDAKPMASDRGERHGPREGRGGGDGRREGGRREGGGRSGGGRGGRDRGPREGRQERGPRAESGDRQQGGRHEGGRHEGGRGPRDSREQRDNRPARSAGAGSSRPEGSRRTIGGPGSGDQKQAGGRNQDRKNGQQPRTGGPSRNSDRNRRNDGRRSEGGRGKQIQAKSTAPASIGKKVSSFFKKLFGQKNP